jgi:large subunit ribosomal protein L35
LKAAKRFKKTSRGRIVRRKALAGHLLTSKTRKRKRNLKRATVVHKADEKRIKRLLLEQVLLLSRASGGQSLCPGTAREQVRTFNGSYAR